MYTLTWGTSIHECICEYNFVINFLLFTFLVFECNPLSCALQFCVSMSCCKSSCVLGVCTHCFDLAMLDCFMFCQCYHSYVCKYYVFPLQFFPCLQLHTFCSLFVCMFGIDVYESPIHGFVLNDVINSKQLLLLFVSNSTFNILYMECLLLIFFIFQ